MASPLKWFRRYQKIMLVVFGVALIAVFGLGSVADMLTPPTGGGGRQPSTVVTWDGGQFSDADLAELRRQHFETMQFLGAVAQRSAQLIPDYRPQISELRMIDTFNASREQLDREVMLRFLLAEKARELGIIVSNGAVLDYLQAYAADRSLTTADLEMVARARFENRLPYLTIQNRLKNELAIKYMMQISAVGLSTTPTLSEAWSIFEKLNRRTESAVLGFAVADYENQVTDKPRESELRRLFEQGQYDYPDPEGHDPGFKQPAKLAVTYITATYDDFLQRAMQNVTAEEVQAEYARLKEEKNSLVMELVPSEETTEPAPGDSANDPPPTLEGPDGQPPVAGDDKTGDDKTGDDKTGDDKTGDDKTGDDKTGDDKTGDDKTGDDKKGDDKKGDDKKGGDGLGSFSEPSPQAGEQFVSISYRLKNPQGDQDKKQTDSQKKSDTQQGDQAKKDDPGDASKSGADGSADPQSGEQGQPPAGAVAADQDAKPGDATAPGAIDEQDPLGIEAQSLEPQRRVKPLDDALAEQIKRQLAAGPTQQAIDEALNDVQSQIEDYAFDHQEWISTRNLPVNERVEKPEPVDIGALASDAKLNYGEVALMDFATLSQHSFGSKSVAVNIENQFGMSQLMPVPIARHLFERFQQLELFHATLVREYLSLDSHILVVVEKEEPSIAEFKDVRDQVERFWRRQRAADLAQAGAEEVAKRLNRDGAKLIESHPNDVKTTGNFTWFTIQLTYPQLQGVSYPGDEFMKVAFGLEVDEAGVARNADGSHYYVIQKIKEDDPTQKQLEDQFFTSLSAGRGQLPYGVIEIFEEGVRGVYREYLAQLEEDKKVRWVGH